VKVALGGFARSGIETRFGADLDAGVEAAAVHYARRLRSARPPVAVPGFLRGAASRTTRSLEVPLRPEVETALEGEAKRSGAPLERILAHAVFVFLADMDAAEEARPVAGATSR